MLEPIKLKAIQRDLEKRDLEDYTEIGLLEFIAKNIHSFSRESLENYILTYGAGIKVVEMVSKKTYETLQLEMQQYELEHELHKVKHKLAVLNEVGKEFNGE